MSGFLGIESLERRTMMSASQISYHDFPSTDGLVVNGFGSQPVLTDGKVRLTSDEIHQARSIWHDRTVPIETFRTDFTFRMHQNVEGADGLTFALINGPTNTLGADGRGLGFGNIAVPSEAVAFNMFNFGKFGSRFGFASNGETPPTRTKMHPIDLHSGHVVKVTVTYDGKVMKTSVADAKDRAKIFSASQEIDLVNALGTNRATVGFTAATGDNKSVQDLLSWNYSGSNRPMIAAAAPSLKAVKTTYKMLRVVATDDTDSEDMLKYSWEVIGKPEGARAPTLSNNNNNDAKETKARFFADGTYNFRVTVTNSAGLTASATQSVKVVQQASHIRVTPHEFETRVGRTVQYGAVMVDQFNRQMRTQPAFAWLLREGKGTINAKTGLFTATESGHVVVESKSDGLTGLVGATVYPAKKPRPSVGAGT